MPDAYFVLASESEIVQLHTVDDVMALMNETEPLLGGECFTLEAITNLCKIFSDEENGLPIQTKYVWIDNSCFYVFSKVLCEKVAETEWDSILDASVPWSEGKPWNNIEHNRMDLAGMIIDFPRFANK